MDSVDSGKKLGFACWAIDSCVWIVYAARLAQNNIQEAFVSGPKRMKKCRIYSVMLFFLAVVGTSTQAATKPQAVDMGPVKFIPTLGVTQKRDDNIFNQPTAEKSSWITQIEPQLQFMAEDRANVYAFTYSGDYGVYSGSSDDDYDDHVFSADFKFDFGAMHDASLSASFGMLHDNRGEGSSEGGVALTRTEPDEYDATGVAGTWEFGRDDARFGVGLAAQYTDVEYQNNRVETEFRDRDDTSFSARLYGRLMPKSRFFLEYATTDISYDVLPTNGVALDSDEQVISVGIEWDITGKTSGSVKVGQTDKDFDAAARDDGDFTSWEAELSWSPRTYSHFFLSTSRRPSETNGTGNFIDSRTYQVMWLHDWSSMVHSNVRIASGDDSYDQDPREDDRFDFSASLDYDFRRWLNVGIGYRYSEKDSNIAAFNYEKNVFFISIDASL